MRVYRLDVNTPDDGVLVSWYPSMRDARRAAAAASRDPGVIDVYEPHLVVIPTTKKGLLKWLSIYLTEDNG